MEQFHKLSELAQAVSECKKCKLSERRNHTVFGEGNFKAKLVLVGEGPGDNEDKTGRPFVGVAGQMLDRALLDNGLNRSDVYICNTVKCRACDWRDNKPFNRPPTPEESAACRNWLEQQLSFLAPKVILCIGSPSANSLIHKGFKITKERGQFFDCEFAEKAIATLHPAYIIRQRSKTYDGGYTLLVEDIAKAWEYATS